MHYQKVLKIDQECEYGGKAFFTSLIKNNLDHIIVDMKEWWWERKEHAENHSVFGKEKEVNAFAHV